MIAFYAFVVTFILGSISGASLLAYICIKQFDKEIASEKALEEVVYGPRSTILKYPNAN